MKARHTALLPALLWSAAAIAQPPGGAPPGPPPPGMGGPGGAPSTQVLPDGHVTFSLNAPNAQNVALKAAYPITQGGGMGPQAQRLLPMTRNEQGLWSITVGPLAPELYPYNFVVDGVAFDDPHPAFTQNGHSVLFVHGAATANYEMNDVPHGTVTQVWYDSPIYQGAHRRMTVYTPPGYEGSAKRYPVLYLLHGGGGYEGVWANDGRAIQIFDNLIAQGKMVPSIVVMPNGGNAGQNYFPKDATRPAPPMAPPPADPDQGPGNPRVKFLTSLTSEIIPFIDRTYRTRADRDNRAVAGQSGGGGESIIGGMNHLDLFSWIGAFSPGWPDVPAKFWVNIPQPADAAQRRGPEVGRAIDPATFEQLVPLGPQVNSRLHLFYFGVGDADGLVETEAAIRKVFDARGVRYQWAGKHDYGHDFDLWRINLQEFAQAMFQPARR